MSEHPDARDQEIARQVAKLEPGDSRFVCSKCLQIREEKEKCLACSDIVEEARCALCCKFNLIECGCGALVHPQTYCPNCLGWKGGLG